jgi:hypothetical protein
MLLEYTSGVPGVDRPPTVTDAEQGVSGAPVYSTFAGHITVVIDSALSIVNATWGAGLPVWLLSPAYVASAVAVPAFVLFP